MNNLISILIGAMWITVSSFAAVGTTIDENEAWQSLDDLTPRILDLRNAGDIQASLDMILDRRQSVTPFERLVLDLWAADDAAVLYGPDAAESVLADMLADRCTGRFMGRSWECWALLRLSDYLIAAGESLKAAELLERAAIRFPNELNPFTTLEDAAFLRSFGSLEMASPEWPGIRDRFTGDSLAVDPVDGADVIVEPIPSSISDCVSIHADGFADRVDIGPIGGVCCAIDAKSAEALIASAGDPRTVHVIGFVKDTELPCVYVSWEWQGSVDRSAVMVIDDGEVTHLLGVDWLYEQPSAVRADATSGFQRPAQHDHAGYCFLEWSSSSGCVHPGWDINGPGGCNDDMGKPIWAVANGTVRGVKATAWGNVVIEHRWRGNTPYSQYGHMKTVTVSVGMNVSKGQQIGTMGNRGTTCAHLHTEIRHIGPYHPDPLNPSYWNSTLFQNRMNVLKIYDSPDAYYTGHPSYSSSSAIIIDEFGTESPNAGPAQYWWLNYTQSCSNESSIYTYSNGSTVSNWHEWKIRKLDTSRSYNVSVYIPSGYPTTKQAKYKLTRNGTVISTRTIDQSANRGRWVSIGAISGSTGQSVSCLLEDATGESVGAKKIGMDSCKFVRR